MHFGLFVAYGVVRLNDTDSTFPPTEADEDPTRTVQMQTTLSILNILILLTAVIKSFYYVRVYEGIGWIVELIGQCLIDIWTFTVFFIFLLFVYGVLFMMGGVNPVDKPGLEGIVIFWIQIFRYSIGDVFDPPEYSYWESQRDKSMGAKTMVVIN